MSELHFVSKQQNVSADSENEEKMLDQSTINKNDSIEEGKEGEEDEEPSLPEMLALKEISEETHSSTSDRKPFVQNIVTNPKTEYICCGEISNEVVDKRSKTVESNENEEVILVSSEKKKIRKLQRSKSQNVDELYAQSIESEDITKSQEDEHYKELTQQPEDYEIGMSSGLLPGCVAPG